MLLDIAGWRSFDLFQSINRVIEIIKQNRAHFNPIIWQGVMKTTLFLERAHQVTPEKELLKQIGHFLIFSKKSMDDPLTIFSNNPIFEVPELI